jgi:hypothetical protein
MPRARERGDEIEPSLHRYLETGAYAFVGVAPSVYALAGDVLRSDTRELRRLVERYAPLLSRGAFARSLIEGPARRAPRRNESRRFD